MAMLRGDYNYGVPIAPDGTKRCPRCFGPMAGCTYACSQCWTDMSGEDRIRLQGVEDQRQRTNGPQMMISHADMPAPSATQQIVDRVAKVLASIKQDHYTFGAEQRLWNRVVGDICNTLSYYDRTFNRDAFVRRCNSDGGPFTSSFYDIPPMMEQAASRIERRPGPPLTATELAHLTAAPPTFNPAPMQAEIRAAMESGPDWMTVPGAYVRVRRPPGWPGEDN